MDILYHYDIIDFVMDVVYICREGENEELRYSIRSVVENMPHSKIWVVGGKPSWYTGNHIEIRQFKTKFANARANMNAIVSSPDISDDFILMNDDFFVMQQIEDVVDYYSGPLAKKIDYFRKKHPSSAYTKLLLRSYKEMKRHGIQIPLDYTLHIPMKMNKQKLADILPLSISWRIAYGNIYNVGGVMVEATGGPTKDVKIYVENGELTDVSWNPLSEIYLSTEDRAFERMKDFFEEKFPKPSPYEKIKA